MQTRTTRGGLANGTCVWTPTGFCFVEDLNVGDTVIGGDGKPCQVVHVQPQPQQRCLLLTFDRGVSIKCAANHPWLALHPAARYPTRHSHGKVEPNPRFDRWEVINAQAMLDASGNSPLPRRRFLIPSNGPVQMQPKDLPVDPYLLGVLLGDGCMRSGGTSISTADAEIIQAVERALPPGVTMRRAGKYDYFLVIAGGKGHGQGGGFGTRGNPLTLLLRELGVHGHLSGDKFVPALYLFNSATVRLAVLQGLMDTDGGVAPTQGTIEFSSTSPHLTAAVEFLVASFGGKSYTEKRVTRFTNKFGERRDGAESFRMRIRLPQVVPFRLTRKTERLVRPVSTCDERILWTISEAGIEACTSIEVDNLDHTVLIDRGVVTHDGSRSIDSSRSPTAYSKLLRP